MRKPVYVFSLLLVIAIFTAVFYIGVRAQGGATSDSTDGVQLQPGSDSNPVGPAEVVIPERYRPQPGIQTPQATTSVWFTPQDENTSTTVIFLYNTSTTPAIASIQTYELDGSLYISAGVVITPSTLVRICADEVSTIAGSWQNVVWLNFRTSSAYGRMGLPTGVRAEAYVVWNGGDTYDPLQIAPTLPIRFSSAGGAAQYLPMVSRGSSP